MPRLRDLETLYPSSPTRFADRVAQVVRAIPKGQTLSYSKVATLAGRPGGARAVVRALHAVKGLPWWRVVRADGTLAEEIWHEQARHLKKEGVKLEGRRLVSPRAPAAKRRARARG